MFFDPQLIPYIIGGAAFLVGARLILKCHKFLDQLIAEKKISGPKTKAIESKMLEWLAKGDFPHSLDSDDIQVANSLRKRMKIQDNSVGSEFVYCAFFARCLTSEVL